MRKRLRVLCTGAAAGAMSAVMLVAGVAGAEAAASPVSNPRILVHFDIDAGETPEAIVFEPDGAALLSLTEAGSAVRVQPNGRVTPVGRLPADGALSEGIARARDGSVYLVNRMGGADSGVWRVRGGDSPTQIAQLPPDSFLNGMTMDERNDRLYVADSSRGVVWAVPAAGGTPTIWADGPELKNVTFLGANYLVLRDGSLWVSNTDQGIIVRIPVGRDGTAGPISTEVTGLDGGLDGFTVFGDDDSILATLFYTHQVVLIRPGAPPQVVLTAADGLSNPTDVQLDRRTVYVSSSAFETRTNPNLLVADFDLRR
jgi:sugar lactone lactonase YvrE